MGFKISNILLYENFDKLWLSYEKKLNTLIHINTLFIWKYKKSNYNCTFIYLKQEHETYTCNSKNVFKCILKHAIIQYYAMKSKIFLLLIIKVKNIHEFNVLSLNLWIRSTPPKKVSLIDILYLAFTQNYAWINYLPISFKPICYLFLLQKKIIEIFYSNYHKCDGG